MRMFFAYAMFFVTLAAMLLFIETIRMQFYAEKQPQGAFARAAETEVI